MLRAPVCTANSRSSSRSAWPLSSKRSTRAFTLAFTWAVSKMKLSPGFEASNWFGVSAPANTPRAITQLLSSSIARVLQQAEIRARIADDGADPVGNTPQEFSAMIKNEISKWLRVVKSAGIALEK
jgi:hypothetical protein